MKASSKCLLPLAVFGLAASASAQVKYEGGPKKGSQSVTLDANYFSFKESNGNSPITGAKLPEQSAQTGYLEIKYSYYPTKQIQLGPLLQYNFSGGGAAKSTSQDLGLFANYVFQSNDRVFPYAGVVYRNSHSPGKDYLQPDPKNGIVGGNLVPSVTYNFYGVVAGAKIFVAPQTSVFVQAETGKFNANHGTTITDPLQVRLGVELFLR